MCKNKEHICSEKLEKLALVGGNNRDFWREVGKVKHEARSTACVDDYSPRRLSLYIASLFSGKLRHGFSPEGFRISTVIPIPKNKKKSLNSSENYRGIALSSILGNLFDCVVLGHCCRLIYNLALSLSTLRQCVRLQLKK